MGAVSSCCMGDKPETPETISKEAPSQCMKGKDKLAKPTEPKIEELEIPPPTESVSDVSVPVCA